MRHIVKGGEPAGFSEWCRKHSADVNWGDFSGTNEHQELLQQLREEQDDLCCYCEIVIDETKTHVEHFKPRSQYPGEVFSYQNMFACCQHPDSCGHKKKGKYFSELISPLSTDCESRFTYTGMGNIIPKDENDTFAQDTIDLLGLNCKRLLDRRKNILAELQNASDDYLAMSLENFKEWYGFYTVVKYASNKRMSL